MQPVPVIPETIFKLDDRFIGDYRDREVPWGFGDLSYITFKRTYARKLTRSILFPDRPEESSDTESWAQCCRRVIEGMITIQKTHCLRQGTPWDEQKTRRTARDAYDRLFHFKWTPPGRGLWMMGTDFVFQRSGAALNSCAFVSTKDIGTDFATPFGWAFEMAMLGVGVGFDCRGVGEQKIVLPEQNDDIHTIGDSREGWRAAIERLLNAFVGDSTLPYKWDYSEIRPQGAPIRSFGGVASGPGPLREAIEDLTAMYSDRIGQAIDAEVIVDTFNLTGRCVVAGGVRRSAQIALGDPDDGQFLGLKQDAEKVQEYRWAANHSPIVEVGQDYSDLAEKTAKNGEPGYFWLDNARKYGRFKDGPDYGDMDALGVNPCVTGDTLVATTQGLQKIEDLIDREDFRVYEDLRYTEDQTRTVVGDQDGVVCRGEKEIVGVELDSGHRLKCTPDHEIVTTDGKVEAQHLSESHEVLLSRADVVGGDQCADASWAEVMGFLVADDLTSEVKSVKPLGKEKVYDVLNTTTSTFIANGIVVSNCGEQPLEDYELCTLVETFPAHHDDYEDYRRTLKMAYLYGKTVSLVPTHSARTNAVMLKNRRIGLSQSGVVQAINQHGYREHFDRSDRGYEYIQQLDRVYSIWLSVPRSIRTTSIKPGGTTPLLAGATPGGHWDHAPYYVRRMEIQKGNRLLDLCREAGYPVEQSVYKDGAMVVEFPIAVDDLQRGKADVSVREKVDLAAQMQHFWSDNAVSCTAEFDPETTDGAQIERILEAYEHRLKGISFLPQSGHGYDQAPYEPITEEEYHRRAAEITPVARDSEIEPDQVDEFCDGEACEVDL